MTEPTREQIIKACKCCQSKYVDCVNCPFYCFAMDECGDCVEAIVCSTEKLLTSDSARIAELEAEVKRLKEERRPISTKTQMPNIFSLNYTDTVLFYTIYDEWRIGYFVWGKDAPSEWRTENSYGELDKFSHDEVTHWQPLPQPPETESEGAI